MADDQDPQPGSPPAPRRPRFPPRPDDPRPPSDAGGQRADDAHWPADEGRPVADDGRPVADESRRAAGRRPPEGPAGEEAPPDYTLYRGARLPRPRVSGKPVPGERGRGAGGSGGRGGGAGGFGGRAGGAGGLGEPGLGEPLAGGPGPGRRVPGEPSRRWGFPGRLVRRFARRPLTFGRIIRWLVVAIACWLGLSMILFVISSHTAPGVSADAKAVLHSSGWPLTSPTTILVLGSDQRPAGSKEAGADPSGPSRSDVMLLIRIGGGHSARLSIPRDTVVSIPGHGTSKINAAFAYGGASLAIQTVEDYLGIAVNHVVEVNFTNFPGLVNSLGGVNYTGSCVVSKISGGFRNGGFTLRLKAGTTHIDGAQALALSRTRDNLCAPAETDLTRARRQQKLFSSIERRVISPAAFIRLPWVAWEAPRAIETDMGATSLLGLFAALETTGSPPTQVLEPSGSVTLPDGGDGLVVSAAERQAAVTHFMAG